MPFARRLRPALAALSMLCMPHAQAFSLGAPICEVQSLPLAPMSSTLATPVPTGWQLRVTDPRYVPGRPMRIEVTNVDPSKRARGVLIWAKSGPVTGIGSFGGDPALYQTIPPALAPCSEWAMSHTSNAPKTQAQLHFDWTAPPGATATVLFRAFVIVDCDDPQGCRAHQALTPVLIQRAGLFFDDFEPGT
jgi:hypothetical protein